MKPIALIYIDDSRYIVSSYRRLMSPVAIVGDDASCKIRVHAAQLCVTNQVRSQPIRNIVVDCDSKLVDPEAN